MRCKVSSRAQTFSKSCVTSYDAEALKVERVVLNALNTVVSPPDICASDEETAIVLNTRRSTFGGDYFAMALYGIPSSYNAIC